MPVITIEWLRETLLYLIALILSISVHEFGHAWMATRLGDRLPSSQGRLTLNPMHHIDLIGTIVFPILMRAGIPGLGWGRPVQTNPVSYTRKYSMRTGTLFVAVAGPAMNLVLAVIVSLAVVVLGRMHLASGAFLGKLFDTLIALNLGLMFFNLLPIPPLDGGAVLARFLPASMQGVHDFLLQYGFLILLGLVFTGTIGYVLWPGLYLIGVWKQGLAGLMG